MTLHETVQMIDAFFRVDLQRGSSCGFCRLPRELCIKSAKERISAQAPWGDTLLMGVPLGEFEKGVL